MVGDRPTTVASFGKSCSSTLRSRAFARRFCTRLRASSSSIVGISFSTSMLAYHTSRTRISLYSAMRSRYERTQDSTASRAQSSLKPLSRQASTKLAARRFTSHSQGAGRVSSRSLMSKITRRSGVANAPKLSR